MTVQEPEHLQSAKEKRIEALSKLDNAKFGWFHVKACVVSGIGFFTVKLNSTKLIFNTQTLPLLI